MTTWAPDQLEAIGRADELEITTMRGDNSARRYVPIWVVRVDNDIYVRSYRGQAGAWYRHAAADRTGRVRAAGFERDVDFEPLDDATVAEAIDRAYQAKYARYSDNYVKPMVADAARAATLRLRPREQRITPEENKI
jgi:hypothetical protein